MLHLLHILHMLHMLHMLAVERIKGFLTTYVYNFKICLCFSLPFISPFYAFDMFNFKYLSLFYFFFSL